MLAWRLPAELETVYLLCLFQHTAMLFYLFLASSSAPDVTTLTLVQAMSRVSRLARHSLAAGSSCRRSAKFRLDPFLTALRLPENDAVFPIPQILMLPKLRRRSQKNGRSRPGPYFIDSRAPRPSNSRWIAGTTLCNHRARKFDRTKSPTVDLWTLNNRRSRFSLCRHSYVRCVPGSFRQSSTWTVSTGCSHSESTNGHRETRRNFVWKSPSNHSCG